LNNELFGRAIELAGQGISVIGADVHDGKKPITNHFLNEWKIFQKRIATEDELKIMFSKPHTFERKGRKFKTINR